MAIPGGGVTFTFGGELKEDTRYFRDSGRQDNVVVTLYVKTAGQNAVRSETGTTVATNWRATMRLDEGVYNVWATIEFFYSFPGAPEPSPLRYNFKIKKQTATKGLTVGADGTGTIQNAPF
jgi:hypothetical protein